MDFQQPDNQPGQLYRPPTSDDLRFNQRTVPTVLIAGIGYGALSVSTPYETGVGLWAFIALVVIPGLCGLTIHSIGDAISTHRRATRAFFVVLFCFVLYGLVNMSLIHDRIQGSNAGAGAMPAILLSAAGYGLVAAAVSGIVASLPVLHHEEHGY